MNNYYDLLEFEFEKNIFHIPIPIIKKNKIINFLYSNKEFQKERDIFFFNHCSFFQNKNFKGKAFDFDYFCSVIWDFAKNKAKYNYGDVLLYTIEKPKKVCRSTKKYFFVLNIIESAYNALENCYSVNTLYEYFVLNFDFKYWENYKTPKKSKPTNKSLIKDTFLIEFEKVENFSLKEMRDFLKKYKIKLIN